MLEDRYDEIERLAEGAQTETLSAREASSGRDVVLKRLDVEELDDWKSLELFERRAETLSSLSHDRIPSIIETFDPRSDEAVDSFVIVQEFIPGPTLTERVEQEGPLGEAAIREFLEQMLDLLSYLHGFSPPVVHRDVKPSNIVDHPDEGYHLIDFGGVQNVVQDTVGGTTMFGTAGYAAPEQLMGRAEPASDIYGLGATALYLGTGDSPDDATDASGRIQMSDFPDFPESLRPIVADMVASTPEDRFESVERVQRALEGDLPVEADVKTPARRSESTDALDESARCSISTEGEAVEIATPTVGGEGGNRLLLAASGATTLTLSGTVWLMWSPVAAVAFLAASVIGTFVQADWEDVPTRFSPVRERLEVDDATFRYCLETKEEGRWYLEEEIEIDLESAYLPYLEHAYDDPPTLDSDAEVARPGDTFGIVVRGNRWNIRFGERFLTKNHLMGAATSAHVSDARFHELARVAELLRRSLTDEADDASARTHR